MERDFYNNLIAGRVNDTIHAARDTLSKTGYTANDVTHIVWVGEETHYKPLRDKVSFELGIKDDILAVNPITALAEGASIFAESIFGYREYLSKIDSEKREIVERRNQLLDTYIGMDLLRNPFYILNATQRDDRNRIIEFAEKQSLLSDADKCLEARAELTMPRKRVSAEVAWLPGVNPERVYDILLLLESSVGNRFASDNTKSSEPVDSLTTVLLRVPYTEKSSIADEVLETLRLSKEDFTEVSQFLGIQTLTPIARANLLAALLLRLPDYTPDVVAGWIRPLVQTFEDINPLEVQATINVEREVSGFPAITELSDVTSAVQNCRRYYRQVIKFALDNIYSVKESVNAVMTVIESATDNVTNRWPILVEDAVDAYSDSAAAFLETKEKNIEALDKKIRIAADEGTPDVDFTRIIDKLVQTVKDWGVLTHPIRLSKSRQGLRHDESHDIADRVRLLAIFLFNEYEKLYFSQKILNVLQEVFTEIPAIAERITVDLEALNRIAERREQQIF